MAQNTYDIDTLLEEVVTLPSMPMALEQVMALMDDPDAAMSDVAKAISGDPSISLKTLRLVNSAYYGLGQEVKTVDHAVVLLGARVVRNLVLSATVFSAIEGMAERFVRHAVATGVAMRTLCSVRPLSDLVGSPDEGFVFGLLHEIGKVLIAEYMPAESKDVATLVAGGAQAHLAEQQIIGVDHAAIGSKLAQRWRLPPAVGEALAGQYDLNKSSVEHRPMAAGLQLANYMCESIGYCSEPRAQAQLDNGALAVCGIAPSALPELLERFFQARHDIDELLRLAN